MATITQIRHKATRAWERERDEDLYGHRVMLLARLVDKLCVRCEATTIAGERCRNVADWPGRVCRMHGAPGNEAPAPRLARR